MGVEQYKTLFVTESEEHLQVINNAVLNLEKNPEDIKILNEIFRSAHTLKGMSATMGYEALTKLTHKMEDVLDIFRSQRISVTSEVIDVLFKCLDTLQLLLEEVKTEKNLHIDVMAMILQLESVIPSLGSIQSLTSSEQKLDFCVSKLEKKNLSQLVSAQGFEVFLIDVYLSRDCQLKSARVFIIFSKLNEIGEIVKTVPTIEDLELNRFGLDFLLLFITKKSKKKIEEIFSRIAEIDRIELKRIKDIDELPEEKEEGIIKEKTQKARDKQQVTKSGDLIQQLGLKKIQSVRVSTQRLDKLMNFVGELVISKIRLMQIAHLQQNQVLNEVLANIDRLTTDLQDEVMQARLVPMSHVFDRFPRMVRDLARNEQKQINFEITGGEIELDRTVLDEIADPLVHLLRNSVNHGIELPLERKNKNKNPVGTIKLSAHRERTFVVIDVSDDGAGIDPGVLRSIAVKKGFRTEEEIEKLDDKEVLNLITLPGFSSVSKITDTSGRGVGMDVVKMKIESLGGMLTFDSKLNKGSEFSLRLPLTVAIIKAMLVKVSDEIYAAPIANIAETVKVSKDKIKHIDKFEVINLRDNVLPLLRMDRVLGKTRQKLKNSEKESNNVESSIVVVEVGNKKAGLVVDEVLGQQEVVIKSMGALLKGIKGFSGATILGDGRVALILDIASLIG